MKYLFLVYEDQKRLEAMSASEHKAFEDACRANNEMLWQSGYLFAIEGLHDSRTATTVRVHNGKVSMTDGLHVEIIGQLTELFFINARDLNEAIQVASNMPQARGGPIEVRPLK